MLKLVIVGLLIVAWVIGVWFLQIFVIGFPI